MVRPWREHAGHLRRKEHQAPRPCVRGDARLNGRRPGAHRPRGGARDQGSVGAAGSWVHDGHSRAEGMGVVYGNGIGRGGLEIGAGGKQHGNNGAVLASAWGMGRGRHLPAPSPALPTNYTNSTATAPSAEAKGPGGRGACGEPRGAWCRRLGRRGEAFRGRVREQHSPKLTTTRIAFIVSLRLHRRKTTRNRRGA